MKVLFLSAPFEYYKGGSEYQYTLIDRYLTERNEDVRYLFRYHGAVEKNDKFITYDYKFRNNYSRYCITDARKIYRMIAEYNPDIVYKRGINYISAIGMKYCHWNNKSYVQHIASSRDVWKYEIAGDFKNRIKAFMDGAIGKSVIKGSTYIIAQANYQDRLMYKHFSRHADYILPNVAPFPVESGKKLLQKQVAWIGNLKPVKRPELFIELARELQHSDARFVMVGRNPHNAWSRDLLERVKEIHGLSYLGEQSLEDVNKILDESHVFVNTSEYEGFPNTYIQAFMRSVPVITLKIDPDDMIEKNVLGFHSRSTEQLKTDVLRLLSDDQLRNRMGQAAKCYSYENHGIMNLEKLYLALKKMV